MQNKVVLGGGMLAIKQLGTEYGSQNVQEEFAGWFFYAHMYHRYLSEIFSMKGGISVYHT